MGLAVPAHKGGLARSLFDSKDRFELFRKEVLPALEVIASDYVGREVVEERQV